MLSKYYIIIVLLFIFNACSKTTPALEAIPEKAAIVAVFDMAEWAKNAQKPYMSNIIDDLKKNLDQSNREVSELFQKISANPQSTGIDFSERAYFYYFKNADGNTYFGLNLPLADQKSFETFLQELAQQEGSNLEIQPETTFRYTKEDQIALGWDDSKAMMLVAENRTGSNGILNQLKYQFEMQPTQSISSQASFMDFNRRKLTLAVWGNMDMIAEMEDIPLEKPSGMEEPIILMGFLTMSDDALSVRAEVSPEVNLMELVTGYDMLETNYDTDGMKLLPKNSYLVASMAMNPTGMYEFMRSEGLTRDLSYDLETGIGWNLEDLMGHLNGSVVMAITKFSPKMIYDYYTDEYIESDQLEPVVNIILGFKDDETLNRFIQSANDNLELISEPLYQVTVSGTPYHLAVIGNQLVISNHHSGVQDYADVQSNRSSYYDSKMIAASDNSSVFAHLNLDFENYPTQTLDPLRNFDLDRASMEIINQFAKRVELKFENTGALEIILIK